MKRIHMLFGFLCVTVLSQFDKLGVPIANCFLDFGVLLQYRRNSTLSYSSDEFSQLLTPLLQDPENTPSSVQVGSAFFTDIPQLVNRALENLVQLGGMLLTQFIKDVKCAVDICTSARYDGNIQFANAAEVFDDFVRR